jgi:hypothetical protein
MKLPAALLVMILPASLAFGQSLAELADNAKKKRKKDTPVYTDEDLKKRSSAPAASAAEASVAAASAGAGSSEGPQGEVGGSNEGSGEGGHRGRESSDAGDEASFRAERTNRVNAIKEAEERIATAQARLNALNNDLDPTNLADPFRLQTLEAEKAKVRQELDAAQADLKRAKEELADFDEVARKRGTPPGWLREP